jgi:plastocyanin
MRFTLIAVLLATAVIAGCGGGDDGGGSGATPTATATEAAGGGGGASVKVSAPADGSLKFDQSSLKAKSGKVTFDFANPSSTPHAFEIEGVDGSTDVITNSDASLTVDLEPGTYTYFCPVGQHRQAGMEGTLTVS